MHRGGRIEEPSRQPAAGGDQSAAGGGEPDADGFRKGPVGGQLPPRRDRLLEVIRTPPGTRPAAERRRDAAAAAAAAGELLSKFAKVKKSGLYRLLRS